MTMLCGYSPWVVEADVDFSEARLILISEGPGIRYSTKLLLLFGNTFLK